jgi:hypothetical protein
MAVGVGEDGISVGGVGRTAVGMAAAGNPPPACAASTEASGRARVGVVVAVEEKEQPADRITRKASKTGNSRNCMERNTSPKRH